jgi:hypothetical protein
VTYIQKKFNTTPEFYLSFQSFSKTVSTIAIFSAGNNRETFFESSQPLLSYAEIFEVFKIK